MSCPHGFPVNNGNWIAGISACEDCEQTEWLRTRGLTIIGVIFLTLVIMVPAVALLMGVFW